jgi:3-oxoacyl-[acyl-carrier-protein] synthase-3
LKSARIIGTGSYLPARVVHNTDLEKIMDTSDEWIRERTGIIQRRYAAEGETTVDMAEHAARRAIEAAGIAPTDIDLIVFATATPDLVFPNSGTLLQARLGCLGVPAFSIEAACSGFIYALSIADKFVRTDAAQRVLVVGAETLSRITDFTDRTTAILFADGAGAVVLVPSDEPGIISTHLHADGSHEKLLYCTGGVSRGYEPGSGGRAVIRMAGRETFKVAVTMLGNSVEEVLQKNGLDKSATHSHPPHRPAPTPRHVGYDRPAVHRDGRPARVDGVVHEDRAHPVRYRAPSRARRSATTSAMISSSDRLNV